MSALACRQRQHGLRDKSVLAGTRIVVVMERLVGTDATTAASRRDRLMLLFKDLDASHPPERANLCDG